MTETITLNDLADRVLNTDVVSAIPDIALTVAEQVPEPISLDELARKVLKPPATQAFPEIDLKIEEADFSFEVQQLRTRASMKGVSLTILLILALTTIACNGAFLLLTLLTP